MMRDISARFKYIERVRSGSMSTTAAAEKEEDDEETSTGSAEGKPSGNAEFSTENSPSRDVIHQHLKRYYQDVENQTADWKAVSDRMRVDLAPYSVLKLGGFSLGNISTKLLGYVLMDNQKIRTLDLGFNRITDKGAAHLATALEHNTTLQSLYLSGNEIGPEGAKAIATALTKNTSLKSLHLSGNNIGEEGARYLAQGLASNRALRSLYIGTNGIGPNGMKAIAEALVLNNVLEELTVGQNKIGSEGVKHLAETFVTGKIALTTLEIGKNGIDHDGAIALAKALCSNQNSLQNLYFDNNPIGDTGASAFGALLAKNTVLRVLDLSYTQMSLLGLRDLSVGLSYSNSLLCLLLDGHDWASTQYMKKTNGLNGMSLSAKGANNFAASCIIGAINSNAKSVLFKLTGVDLSLVVTKIPDASSNSNSSHVNSSSSSGSGSSSSYNSGAGEKTPTTATADQTVNSTRRYSDTLSLNEKVLKYLQETRPAAPMPSISSHKRKNADDDKERESGSTTATRAAAGADTAKTAGDNIDVQQTKFPKLKASSSAGSMGSRGSSMDKLVAAANKPLSPSAVRRIPRVLSRGQIVQFPPIAPDSRLSLKSPRYESTMEVHVRKVIADIAKLPFSANEYATLQTYYLGGTCGSVDGSHNVGKVEQASGSLCPACQSSRLARYPKTMALKSRLETKREATEAKLLVILRQLHYLIGAFQHVDNPELTIDNILVSMHRTLSQAALEPERSVEKRGF